MTLILRIALLALCLVFSCQIKASLVNTTKNTKLVYVTDLNLFPTPLAKKEQKHVLEKTYGVQVYESQTIFQEIIRYLNKDLDFDFVVFGGNSISSSSGNNNFLQEEIFQLFLDMASEIKSNYFMIFGKNEHSLKNREELIKVLKLQGLTTKDTWWSYQHNDILLIGLDSTLFFNHSDLLVEKQIKWLKDILSKNNNLLTLIFLHQSIITPEGNFLENENRFVKEFSSILKNNKQIKLIISGNEYINRHKALFNGNITYLISSGPTIYPCIFKYIEINKSKISIKAINVPLKGIVKKAKMSIIQSGFAKSKFPQDPKLITNYVTDDKSDLNFDIYLDKH